MMIWNSLEDAWETHLSWHGSLDLHASIKRLRHHPVSDPPVSAM